MVDAKVECGKKKKRSALNSKNHTTQQLQQAGTDAGGADVGPWRLRMEVEQM